MHPFLVDYATAMADVARRFPDDNDVRVLSAEAAMTANAWKLWTRDGRPADGTPAIVAALEAALAKDATHPGANHYYIHVIEASPAPAKALAAAERTGRLAPGAGHLVHMPAHIFQRVGRYADAEAANRDGAAADLAYIGKVGPFGYYPSYLAHNLDFEAYSASMRGRSRVALDAQKQAAESVPASLFDTVPGLDFFASKPLFVQLRFGRWDAILATPAPPERYASWAAVHRFARAYALAARGRIDEAAREKAALDRQIAALPTPLDAGFNDARTVFSIAALWVEARIASARGREADAIRALRAAIAIEDRLAYDEPEDWVVPTRHVLGAALLRAGRAGEAEAAYREDLARHPENGWALYGLARALTAQRKDARAVSQRFATAWKDADVTLTASAL